MVSTFLFCKHRMGYAKSYQQSFCLIITYRFQTREIYSNGAIEWKYRAKIEIRSVGNRNLYRKFHFNVIQNGATYRRYVWSSNQTLATQASISHY